MERKIGEEFEFNGVRLRVVEGEECENCYFVDKHKGEACARTKHISVSGFCSGANREDSKSVQFVEIKNENMKDQEIKSLPIPEGWEFVGYENGEVKIRKIEPNKNPFTDRTNILVITDVKDGWVRVNNNGLLDDYKIEDFYSKLKRYVRFKQCTGWYIKDRMDNILLIIK